MSSKYGARGNPDGNHHNVGDYFKAMGFDAIDLKALGGGIPDWLFSREGRGSFLVEVKNPLTKGKRSEKQESWASKWRGMKVHLVETLEQAQAVAKLYPAHRPIAAVVGRLEKEVMEPLDEILQAAFRK